METSVMDDSGSSMRFPNDQILTIGSEAHQSLILKTTEKITKGLKYDFSSDLDWITERIALGPGPLPEGRVTPEDLTKGNITHIVSIRDKGSPMNPAEYLENFKQYVFGIQDYSEIPVEDANGVIRAMHEGLHSSPLAKLYIHCSAGQNRSPNILSLYLIAAGLTIQAANSLIEAGRMDTSIGTGLMLPENCESYQAAEKNWNNMIKQIRKDLFNIILPSA